MIENSKKSIPVLVSGALGRMGREVISAVLDSPDCELVAAIDFNKNNNGKNISDILKLKKCNVIVSNDFEKNTKAVLCSAFLRETPSSYVEWHKKDQ